MMLKFIYLFVSIFAIGGCDKVLFDLYMESLCPDCIGFEIGQLAPVFAELGSYMTVKIYPFGNGHLHKEGDKYVFTCQHGPLECLGNRILGCAINMSHQDTYVPFSSCTIKKGKPNIDYVQCAERYNIDLGQLQACINGPLGDLIQYENAIATPPHPHVPYIMINKVYDSNTENRAITDLKGVICDHLKVKPKTCTTMETED